MNWLESLRFRWFNIPSSSRANSLLTKGGSKYWIYLEDERPEEIIVVQKAKTCGLVRMIWNKDQLELWDVFIWENHRRNGLGTALLQWIIEYARQQNVPRIWAIISPEKGLDFNRVMNWYIKQGFHRESPDSWVITYNLREIELTSKGHNAS